MLPIDRHWQPSLSIISSTVTRQITVRYGLTICTIKSRRSVWKWLHERDGEHGQMVTRRDRCTRIIATISRAGRDHEICKSLDNILMWRGLSALTDAAIEDLATRVAADEHARRSKRGVSAKIASYILLCIAQRVKIEVGEISVRPATPVILIRCLRSAPWRAENLSRIILNRLNQARVIVSPARHIDSFRDRPHAQKVIRRGP